jgi:hypothetical protein
VDVYAQRIVGWHTMRTRPAGLVLLPLRMAAWARGQQGQLIARGELVHHSDAGSQYLAIRFTEHLQLEGITPSVGSVGDAYDNALMESIIGLYKVECVRPGPFHTGPFKTLSEVEFATMAWVDWYTTDACTPPSACAHPSSTRPPTTLPPLPSNRSRSPYEDGTTPVTVHPPGEGSIRAGRPSATRHLARALCREPLVGRDQPDQLLGPSPP